jgi:hypothetical protein
MSKEEFWQLTYLAALFATYSNEDARTLADQAVKDWEIFTKNADVTHYDGGL